MVALDKHDQEIKNTLARINKCVENNSWNLVNDLTRYLTKLLRQRKEYVRYKKNGSNKCDYKRAQ